jgi:MYXO-CTERM domain-containing protein
MSRAPFYAVVTALAIVVAPPSASAATILFVSNTGGDTNIPTALMADGHVVITGTSADLAGDLSAFEAVFWSSTSSYSIASSTFTNLTSYVMGGGRVFVTGYDGVISNTELANFCGASSARDLVGSPGPGAVVSVANSLTVGVLDIRGVTPTGGHTDRDGLSGLLAGTVEVVPSAGGGTTQWALRTVGDGEIAYVSNGTYGGPHPSWEATGGGAAGAYNAAIRNFAFSADFAMSEPGAPEITFDAPFSADEGDAVELRATIEDLEGDTVTFSWDLDDDGTFGENEGLLTYMIAAGTTDGSTSMRIGIEAVDSGGNTSTRYRNLRVVNVDPVITSDPPLVTSVGVDFRYPLAVEDPAGELDPLTFTMLRGPSRMTVSPEGVVQWSPAESDVTLPGETIEVEVGVDDGDGGAASQLWQMTVSPNRQPSPAVPAYPIDMVAIVDPLPRLAATNSQDLDLDELTYYFQIDTVPTFDSADLRESGPLEETPGFTAWQLDAPLASPRAYYWRVWSNDGSIDSPTREAGFYVVRDPSAPLPDAGLPDAGPEADGGGIIPGIDAGVRPGDGGGCSCRASAPSRSRGWIALVLVGLAIAARRRR